MTMYLRKNGPSGSHRWTKRTSVKVEGQSVRGMIQTFSRLKDGGAGKPSTNQEAAEAFCEARDASLILRGTGLDELFLLGSTQ